MMLSTEEQNIITIPANEKTHWRVAVYCRVSTFQEEQYTSLSHQMSHYSRLVEETPEWELAGVYTDQKSGTDFENRLGLVWLIADCFAGKIDLILTKSVSRLGRDTLHYLNLLAELRKRGIHMIFDKEKIDTRTMENTLDLTAHIAVAQHESDSLSQNITWGMQEKFRSGGFQRNTNNLLGYTKDIAGNLVIVPEEAEIVRKIYELYADGYGARKISNYLTKHGIKTIHGKDKWSISTIQRILENEKYLGYVLSQKTIVDTPTRKQIKNDGIREQYLIKNNHEAIIGGELLERYLRRKQRSSSQPYVTV